MNLHLQKMKIDSVGGQKFLACLLTDGALLLKMYCQRDKALGSSSLDPTSHPSQPMHSHSAIFTLAFRLSLHTESQDCFRLCRSPLPPSLSLSLSFSLPSLPPAQSALAVADTLQSQTLALASTCSLHQNQQIRLAQFKNTEQERKSKNKALIDGNKRHHWGLNRTVIWRFFVPVGDWFPTLRAGFPWTVCKSKNKRNGGERNVGWGCYPKSLPEESERM